MKRRLSVAQAVEAAAILFSLNSGRDGVLLMAARSGLPCSSEEEIRRLLLEWRAFVHAAVLYGLMVQAPNVVVVAYLRSTQDMLKQLGYTQEQADAFVDGAFRAYSEPLVRTRTQECPAVFFRRLLDKDITDVPAKTAATVSGIMAMILSAVLDKLEQYDYALD
ncbi:hypothetical protein [uncultured Mailhella sp.]|uniref:hypothetical protein n=1 Tax=uncultured Mailhella sp. TaxID=1981031 RepID=UPI0026060D49|nr:hypothetical protein [uncultured Mailhella sp.]